MTDVEMMFSHDDSNITFTQQLLFGFDSTPDQPAGILDVLKNFLKGFEKQSQDSKLLKEDKIEFEHRVVDSQINTKNTGEGGWT